MKKGVSHIDWAISMGIFIVFAMLAIIFLIPNPEPAYQGDVLLKSISDSLMVDTYSFVKKQALYIDSTVACITSMCNIRVREASNNGLDPTWFDIVPLRTYLAVLNETQIKYDEAAIDFDVWNEFCDIFGVNPAECTPPQYYPAYGNVYVLDFTTYLNPGNNTFYLLQSDNFSYNTYTDTVNVDMEDNPATAGDWCASCVLDGYNYTYSFGVQEIIKGFSEDKINALDQNYTKIKEDWNIPYDKHFRLTMFNLSGYDGTGLNFSMGFPLNQTHQEQINVFVRNWKDWLLMPEGYLVPIEVNVEVW